MKELYVKERWFPEEDPLYCVGWNTVQQTIICYTIFLSLDLALFFFFPFLTPLRPAIAHLLVWPSEKKRPADLTDRRFSSKGSQRTDLSCGVPQRSSRRLASCG